MSSTRFLGIILIAGLIIGCDKENIGPGQVITVEDSMGECGKLLIHDPQNCECLKTLALGYVVQKQPEEAIPYFEKLVVNCPNDHYGRWQYGLTLSLFIGDFVKGMSEIETAAQIARKASDERSASMYERDLAYLKNQTNRATP